MEDKYYFIKRMNEKILWTYKPNTYTKIWYIFSTIFWVPLPILLLGFILCLFKVTDWKIMILFVMLSIFSYLNKVLQWKFINLLYKKIIYFFWILLIYEFIKYVIIFIMY